MPRTTTQDNYEAITARFVEALEGVLAGTRERLPWQRPWNATASVPCNGVSKRPYSGLNVLLLWCSDHTDHRWYTFNQVKKNFPGSFVRKGEHGTKITFWKFLDRTEKATDKDGNEVERQVRVPMLRVFTVFNHQQIQWAPGKEPQLPAVDPTVTVESLNAHAMSVLEGLGANVTHGGDRACYVPASDTIRMPPVESFTSPEGYVGVRAHETVHWTGHESRLGRNLSSRFGSESYAAEELVAELGAAFLCAEFGVQTPGLDAEHEAYLLNWVNTLRNDKYALFTASRLAREAAAFVLNQGEAEVEDGEGVDEEAA